ncbi:MAG TPA: hypothetical protein VNE38_04290 [Ktedonobacteraceae bacterium]|nr:hypothetical protein [Ktedonobacteraceae bacterium]
MVQESPLLQAYLPGTRIASAALLYSFGGSSAASLRTNCSAPVLPLALIAISYRPPCMI